MKSSFATTPQTQTDSRYINRELSWLEFNKRVLEQAYDKNVPLMERAKFLAITSSNLDEFIMVRVGSLKLQLEQNPLAHDPTSRTVTQQLREVITTCRELVHQQNSLYTSEIESALRESGIRRLTISDCNPLALQTVEQKLEELEAICSPQIVPENANFPLLQGLNLHLCVRLKRSSNTDDTKQVTNAPVEPFDDFAILPIGKAFPRTISIPTESGYDYVLIEDALVANIHRFFPGRDVLECIPFRLTRNADVELREDSAADLMVGMEEVLESRRRSRVIRLEYVAGTSEQVVSFLKKKMKLAKDDLYPIHGPIDLTYLFGLHALRGFEAIRDIHWPAQIPPKLDPAQSIFKNIADGDHLLVHPYESFDPVVRLIEEASTDKDVVAIKQVLYRTSKKSPIVSALKRAAQTGKYVSVIVELKARFDEARNIEWAREMERAGVQVIYGLHGLKTHAKVCIIVRREPNGIARYMHFGTGNYNEVTAKLYSDISFLTCNEELGTEATSFFNAVTGASQPRHLQEIAAAPNFLRPKLLSLIEQEKTRSEQGQKGEIIAKLNALVDPVIIEALYGASQAGVKIKLNIRGVCCLRPGVKGLSENITVISIVDRFLEHARILYFRHGGSPQVYISSADWMPRNLDRRIELLIPIHDHHCVQKLTETLRCYFKDNTNCWLMHPDGSYARIQSRDERYQSQHKLYINAQEAASSVKNAKHQTFEPHRPKTESGD
ncbi:MAG: polyphosphate kinase 1 [Rubripirellula sp.]|nr:polyphosphate kinase 1 [Rubripirellula sp.]